MAVKTPPSRIYIKNLPHALTVEDFRKHFSQLSPITDAKLLVARRIGYVGYRTPDDAERAVKYFDRSFLGMARVSVEVAKPVGEPDRKRRKIGDGHRASNLASQTDREDRSSANSAGASTLASDDKSSDVHKFVREMQPSVGRTWQNDDQMPVKGSSEGELDCMPQMTSKAVLSEARPVLEEKLPSGHPSATAEGQSHDNTIDLRSTQGQVESQTSPLEMSDPSVKNLNATISDSDWLRSRTSRLLGLLDDDDDDVQSRNDDDRQLSKLSSTHRAATSSPISGASSIQNGGDATESQAILDESLNQAAETPNTAEEGRLFVRNLTYTATEEDLRGHFEPYGDLSEAHLPKDSRSGMNKGFAHIAYKDPPNAQQALVSLDHTTFQGRILHVLPSAPKRDTVIDDFAFSKLPLKKQAQIRRKAEATTSTFQWNSLFMSADAVVSSVADRLNLSKSQLLDPTSSDAAIKQAHAETHVIQETKTYFASENVSLDAFKSQERGSEGIVVKNFPYGTTINELRQLFEEHVPVKRVLMPPAGTIAIVELENPESIKYAFEKVAYRRYKNSLLLLERAPRGLFNQSNQDRAVSKRTQMPTSGHHDDDVSLKTMGDISTLFIKNLSFQTTSQRLQEVCADLKGFRSARVKTKTDPKNHAGFLSMGFGFVEFQSGEHAEAARTAIDGLILDGHQLLAMKSHKGLDAAEQRRRADHLKRASTHKTKIIIKNLPFEASKNDVRSLFGAYGKLRSVRMPRKFDSSTRGFAFADFVSSREAESAAEALRDTHLLGRKLVLDFAAEESIDPEQEIEQMQRKVSKQNDKVALQRLIAGSARKKFAVEGVDE